MNTATEAQLHNPYGIFVSSCNEVYIADQNNHRIRKILRNGNIVTIAGNGTGGFSGDNGPATNAQLYSPFGVFVSSNNEVYIADQNNNRIRKILQNGNIVTIAGNGNAGFSGDNGPAINAELNAPMSVFVSSNNEIYIAEYGTHRIRKILQNGNIITIAGNRTHGFSGDNGPAINAQLCYPRSVFVSSNNEIYIADQRNHRIRKVLENGNITTIAGNGNRGFSGDNGPATSAQLNYPISAFVSLNNEVFIVDQSNHRIRKILQNGNIVTIAGNGTGGFSGDNGLATSAQLSYPSGVFVSSNNEVYIADLSNQRIRKILQNGNIITIAGNGTHGFSGDSLFDIALFPHINSTFISKTFHLKKHSRDQLYGMEIYAFLPLIEKISFQFCKILKNEKITCSMNSSQQVIIQKLIDYLIYEKEIELRFEKNEILNVLFILGLFKNGEFINLKQSLISDFVNNVITLQDFPSLWETIESMIKICNEQFGIENYILEKLNNYCIEYAVIQMRTIEGNALLPTLPIIYRNGIAIFSKMIISQLSPITIDDENVEFKPQSIESLFNDKKTSCIQIKMGDNYLYCHKTILSSTSTLFKALFESGSSFSDLNNGIFTPDESEDLELLEIIIKTCYGIEIDKVNPAKIMPLLDMAMKHEIEQLVNYCKNNFTLSLENYFEIVSSCENYFEMSIFEEFYREVVRFGIANRKQLFTDYNSISKLPEKVWQTIILQLSQDCN